jgi:hypothetical protein
MGRSQKIAHRLMPGQAIAALTARDVVRRKHPVANSETVHTRTDLYNLCSNLMPQNKRRLPDTVPLHQITTADPAGTSTQKQLAGTNFWNWQFLQPNIPIIVVHGDAHIREPVNFFKSPRERDGHGPLQPLLLPVASQDAFLALLFFSLS